MELLVVFEVDGMQGMPTEALEHGESFIEPLFRAAKVVNNASFFVHRETVLFGGLLDNLSEVDDHLFIKRVCAGLKCVVELPLQLF